MCDYSLMSLPNRLAVCGDELIVHRFELGAIGLASAADVRSRQKPSEDPKLPFSARLKKWFYPPVAQPCTAVCIPPGARLLVRDLPERLQQSLRLESDTQEVTFTQTGTVGFRDAIRFCNGVELLLQKLTEGQRIRVLALSMEDESSEPAREARQVVTSYGGI